MADDNVTRLAKPEWWSRLLVNKNGFTNTVANAISALTHAPDLQGLVGFDEFAQRITVLRDTPWPSRPAPRPWTDADDTSLQEWLQHNGIPISAVSTVSQAVIVVATRNGYDPLKQYLESLEWDETPRLLTWCTDFLGAADTTFSREAGRRFLISAVARGLSPGCKVDHALVLEGEQGINKSTAIRTLGGKWTQDDIHDMSSKDAAMALANYWIVELQELSALNRSEIERTKSFLSLGVDKYRPPYGRHVIEVPRRCVFAGTTNADRYLRDPTGNRRFWPIRCGRIDLGGLAANRDQLFAEAVAAYHAGQVWHLTDAELIAQAQCEQALRLEVDPWHAIIAEKIVRRDTITNRELLEELEIPVERQSGGYAKRIGTVMRALGWVDEVSKAGGQRDVTWRPRAMRQSSALDWGK